MFSSNAAMDENGRAMNMHFQVCMGIYPRYMKMQDLDDSREGVGRVKHDPKDGGGRIASGTAIEEARTECACFIQREA